MVRVIGGVLAAALMAALASGVSICRTMFRITMLTASLALDSARHANDSQNARATPNITVAAP